MPNVPDRVGRVVNAGGAWASRFAAMIGYSTPVYAIRRQVSIFDVRDFDMSHYGMMVDPSGVYFHPEATNILGGYADHSEPKGWNLDYDGESFFQEKIWMPLFERSTKFEQLKHLTGWGGLYEMTPDQTGIVSAVRGVTGLYVIAGFSGHGFMHGPIAGQLMAEIVVDGRASTVDAEPLGLDRFARGETSVESLTFT